MNDIIIQRIKNIKMISMDVDGVLTDGSIYLGDGIELKKFNVQDGYAIKNFFNDDILISFITGRYSEAVSLRAKELNVDNVFQDVKNKKECQEKLNKKYNFSWDEICFIGDDFPDLEVMKSVGIKMCPNNAIQEIKEICDYSSNKDGGNGAIREIFEFIKYSRLGIDKKVHFL